MELKKRRVLFAGWGCENPKDTYMHQIWFLTLKKIFPNLNTFDTKKYYFQQGKKFMNDFFLKEIGENNYDLVISAMEYDEFYPETLKKVREINKEMRSIIIICDDDTRFDSWSRYIGLFFEGVIQSPPRQEDYKKEGIKNSFFHFDYNTYKLKPQKLRKLYDVTFIGRPKADRLDMIKYLMDKGVNIKLFGWGWKDYPELKKIYGGPLSQEDYAKIINGTEINLNFTRAGYSEEKQRFNMKGRFFEVALCKGFQLIEDYPGIERFFRDKKEVVLFKTKEDLLKKINYYLQNKRLMEKIAENSYKKTITKYNREKDLKRIFTKIFEVKESWRSFPAVKEKVVTLNKKDIFSKNLVDKLKNVDYITFRDKNLKKASELKDYFLSRALTTTGKPLSCCDYYVSSLGLEDYMLFTSKFAFVRIGNEANRLLDINQFMVKKDYFLNNLGLFRNLAKGKEVELVSDINTAFVSIPLITITKLRKLEYEKILKTFGMRFPNELFSLIYRKKILISAYPYLLILKSVFGNRFILKYLKDLRRSKSTLDKLSVNETYLKKSPFEKFIKK